MPVNMNKDRISLEGKPIYSSIFTFSGGGTQTVKTLGAGEAYIMYAVQVNYGGSDFRHGSVYYATRASNGLNIRAFYLGSQQGNSVFSTSGTADVTYSAGGGNPYTTLYMLRVH
jgi:hypothetical protein